MHEGIVLVDKPLEWTSHDVVAKIRNLTKVKKVGHAGTLDPLATGLLIVLVGKKYTKQQTTFLKQDKRYLCTGKIGSTTDTYDMEGKITSTADWDTYADLTQTDIEKLLPIFTGTIQQTVPAFSSVKQKGKKLYELAREGGEIVLPTREVTISKLTLTDFVKNTDTKEITFTLDIRCGSGTYIRSLVYDIGEKLGFGATVTMLRRTEIGEYSVDNAKTMEEIITNYSEKRTQ